MIIVKLSQQYPKETFYEYSRHIVGKWLGHLISIVFITYFLALGAYEVRVMSEIVDFFLLEGTPSWAIIMTVLWIGLYSITQGLDPIARLFEMIFPITVIIFLTIALMSLGIFEINNLRPVLGDGIMLGSQRCKDNEPFIYMFRNYVHFSSIYEKAEKCGESSCDRDRRCDQFLYDYDDYGHRCTIS